MFKQMFNISPQIHATMTSPQFIRERLTFSCMDEACLVRNDCRIFPNLVGGIAEFAESWEVSASAADFERKISDGSPVRRGRQCALPVRQRLREKLKIKTRFPFSPFHRFNRFEGKNAPTIKPDNDDDKLTTFPYLRETTLVAPADKPDNH